MTPAWLTAMGWIGLAAAIVSVTDVLVDIYIRGNRQQMSVMEAVWPVTALYAPGAANVAYRRWGRRRSPHWQRTHEIDDDDQRPMAVSTALGVSHCGAGCTLGDIVGSTIVFVAGWQLAGHALFAEYVANFTLAFAIGIVFQYLTIAPMRNLRPAEGIVAALRADTASLIAFEVGMFGWMAFIQLIWLRPSGIHPDHAAYWFLMQLGMLLGFLTAYPVNWWLLRRGLKEAM